MLVCMNNFFKNITLFEVPNIIMLIVTGLIILMTLSVKKSRGATNSDITSLTYIMLVCGLYFCFYQMIVLVSQVFSISDLFSIFFMGLPFFLPYVYQNLGPRIKNPSLILKIIKYIFIIASLSFIYTRFTLGRIWGLDEENAAGYVNSIYYLLLFFPFLILFKRRWPYIVLMFVCVVLSGKRTPFIAFSLVMLVFFIDSLKKKHKSRNVILLSLLFLIFIYVYDYISTVYDVVLFSRFENLQEDEGSGRFEIFQFFVEKIKNSSTFEILLGHGGRNATSEAHSMNLSAHNDFIEILFDYGIIGLLFIVGILWKLVLELIKNIRNKSKYSLSLAVSLCIFITIVLFSNLVLVPYFLLFAIFWAFIFEEISYEKKSIGYCS